MFTRYLARLGRLACRAVVYRSATARRVFSASLTISPGGPRSFLALLPGLSGASPHQLPITSHQSFLTSHNRVNGVVELAVVDRVPANGVFRIDLSESPVPGDLFVNIFGLALHWSLYHRIDADDRH